MRRRVLLPVILVIAAVSLGVVVVLRRGGSDSRQPPHAVALAGSRCGVSQAVGDFDGDGRADLAVVYARLAHGAPCDYSHAKRRYFVRIRLANGTTYKAALGNAGSNIESSCSPTCIALAAPDIDRDRKSELAVELGHGASEVWFGLYALDRGRLARYATEARVGRRTVRRSAEFRLFGSLGHGGDFACRMSRNGVPLVVQSTYGVTGAKSFVAGETVYAVRGLVLRRLSNREWTGRLGAGYPPVTKGRRCLQPSERVLGQDPTRV